MDDFLDELKNNETDTKETYNECDSFDEYLYPKEGDFVENGIYEALKRKDNNLFVSTGF